MTALFLCAALQSWHTRFCPADPAHVPELFNIKVCNTEVHTGRDGLQSTEQSTRWEICDQISQINLDAKKQPWCGDLNCNAGTGEA